MSPHSFTRELCWSRIPLSLYLYSIISIRSSHK